MARVPHRVAQQILVMAESRGDVVRRELGVSDMVDYYVEIEVHPGAGWSVPSMKLVFCGDTGFEIKDTSTIGLGRGRWVSKSRVLNVFAAFGYMADEIKQQVPDRLSHAMEPSKHVVHATRIPRVFALEHVLDL